MMRGPLAAGRRRPAAREAPRRTEGAEGGRNNPPGAHAAGAPPTPVVAVRPAKRSHDALPRCALSAGTETAFLAGEGDQLFPAALDALQTHEVLRQNSAVQGARVPRRRAQESPRGTHPGATARADRAPSALAPRGASSGPAREARAPVLQLTADHDGRSTGSRCTSTCMPPPGSKPRIAPRRDQDGDISILSSHFFV
jgi:hypothetical protein